MRQEPTAAWRGIMCEPVVAGIISRSHAAAFSHQEPPIYSHYDTYASLVIIFIQRQAKHSSLPSVQAIDHTALSPLSVCADSRRNIFLTQLVLFLHTLYVDRRSKCERLPPGPDMFVRVIFTRVCVFRDALGILGWKLAASLWECI